MDGIFPEHGAALEDEQRLPVRRLREVRGALPPAFADKAVFEGRGKNDGDADIPDCQKNRQIASFVLTWRAAPGERVLWHVAICTLTLIAVYTRRVIIGMSE